MSTRLYPFVHEINSPGSVTHGIYTDTLSQFKTYKKYADRWRSYDNEHFDYIDFKRIVNEMIIREINILLEKIGLLHRSYQEELCYVTSTLKIIISLTLSLKENLVEYEDKNKYLFEYGESIGQYFYQLKKIYE